MKKLSYLLGLLLFGSLVFTSCGDDDPVEPQDLTPTIDFTSGGDDVTIIEGESIDFGVACNSNSISGKKLENFKIYLIVNNETQAPIVDSTGIDENAFAANYTITFDNAFTGKLYAEITDVDGEKSNVSFNITVEVGTTPLEGEQDLLWERTGAPAGTGLDMFGLKWTSNVKMVNAVIKKDMADKFVQLTAAEWTSITTKEDLMAAVEAATGIEEYTGVSVDASGTYDDVLATKYGEDYFIMHIEAATVTVVTEGTKVSITGKYNK
jgi:hypothetical protein